MVLKSGVTISASVRNSSPRGVKRIFFRNTYNYTNYKNGVNDTVVNIGTNNGIFTLYTANKTKKEFIRLNHEEMYNIMADAGFKTSLMWDGAKPFWYLFARRE